MTVNKNNQETSVLVGMEQNEPPSYSQVPGVVPSHQGGQPGPPPSYDDVTNPDAPPPSYNSLFGQVREARRSSTGFLEFICKVILILIGTLGCTIICGVVIIIPVAMVIIGAIHLKDCPVEPYIPIYLVVGGAFGVMKQLVRCYQSCFKNKEQYEEKENSCMRTVDLFLFAWFIAGCVWVYSVYEPDYNNVKSPNYCNKTVYLFSFWLLNLMFIFVGISMTLLCCVTICAILLSDD